jgi:GTP-binding protein
VPTKQVYAGMLIGECARENDMEVNPVREKKLTNVRAANNDDKARALSVRHFGK